MRRLAFLATVTALTASLGRSGAVAKPSREIAGIGLPATHAARDAEARARAALPPEIYNHSLRTYLFAELIARAKKIDHDSELVYIAAILHDTGMSEKYMSVHNPFEVDGANVARGVVLTHDGPTARADTVWDAVALHDNGGIATHKPQAEVVLVNAGVNADFGAYLDLMTKDQIVDVLTAAPRAHFIDVFLASAAKIAKKKPLASAHSFVADVGYRKVPGFHLTNFCDAVKEDPFAAYK